MEDCKEVLPRILTTALTQFDLPGHPFVKRFAAGEFSQDAIRWWAIKMLPGSNRFNQAFLKVASLIEDYRTRILMLRNIYTEHGELNPDAAHVALFMRFMRGIVCPRIDTNEDDGSFTIPELRFKRFEVRDDEPLLFLLGKFAAIEVALPGIFVKYIEGLRRSFPGIDDHTIEYFHIHCELDPTHTEELLQVASRYISSELDIEVFSSGVQDMLTSISDMFSWMNRYLASEAYFQNLAQVSGNEPLMASNSSPIPS